MSASLTLYFHHCAKEDAIIVYQDRHGREGGSLPRGEGYLGVPFEALKKASAGKIVPCPNNETGFEIKPARRKLTLSRAV